jgi:hypothetical protein
MLGTSFAIHSSFAMGGQEENANIVTRGARSLYNLVTAVADSIDHLQGIDVEVAQRASSFFPALLTDEITMSIFLYLYEDKTDIKNLCSVALTCTHGDQLMQDSKFWDLLKEPYFDHLPEEYISVLLQDKKDGGLKLCSTLFKQLLAYQVDETKWLSQTLSGIGMQYWSMLDGINNELRQEWCNRLVFFNTYDEFLNDSILNDFNLFEKKENKEKTKFKRYMAQEGTLNNINSKIINECLKDPPARRRQKIRDSDETHDILTFSFHYSITRVPQEGVELIKRKLFSFNQRDAFEIDFCCNRLRWIPDELFSIGRIETLNLTENLLCYLSKKIECLKDHLVCLHLNTLQSHGLIADLFPNVARRWKSGNMFKTIPPVVFKLKNLRGLSMSNVGLEELPLEEIFFKELPKLQEFDVSQNNLQVVFKPSSQYSYVRMESYGNPGNNLPIFSCFRPFREQRRAL